METDYYENNRFISVYLAFIFHYVSHSWFKKVFDAGKRSLFRPLFFVLCTPSVDLPFYFLVLMAPIAVYFRNEPKISSFRG